MQNIGFDTDLKDLGLQNKTPDNSVQGLRAGQTGFDSRRHRLVLGSTSGHSDMSRKVTTHTHLLPVSGLAKMQSIVSANVQFCHATRICLKIYILLHLRCSS